MGPFHDCDKGQFRENVNDTGQEVFDPVIFFLFFAKVFVHYDDKYTHEDRYPE
jgi:hypothetical protein